MDDIKLAMLGDKAAQERLTERGGDGDAGGDGMKIGDITATLAKKAVVNVIYKEWLHEGHIDIEHTEDFRCVIDGKLYEITVREVGTVLELPRH